MLCAVLKPPQHVRKHGVNITTSVKEKERDSGSAGVGGALLRHSVLGDPCGVADRHPGLEGAWLPLASEVLSMHHGK